MHDASTGAPRILVVDESAPIRDLLRLLLTAEGYRVAGAGTLRDALSALAAEPPDLLILEARLPGVPAFALLDRLEANQATATLPVIVCSAALRTLEAARERLARPDRAVLLKPFDIDQLLASTTRLLGCLNSEA